MNPQDQLRSDEERAAAIEAADREWDARHSQASPEVRAERERTAREFFDKNHELSHTAKASLDRDVVEGRMGETEYEAREEELRQVEINERMAAIDFNQEVRVRTIKEGELVSQWRHQDSTRQGDWYSPISAKREELGISHWKDDRRDGEGLNWEQHKQANPSYDSEKNERVVMRATRDVEVLESTASALPERHLRDNHRHAAMYGGGKQYTTYEKDAFAPLIEKDASRESAEQKHVSDADIERLKQNRRNYADKEVGAMESKEEDRQVVEEPSVERDLGRERN